MNPYAQILAQLQNSREISPSIVALRLRSRLSSQKAVQRKLDAMPRSMHQGGCMANEPRHQNRPGDQTSSSTSQRSTGLQSGTLARRDPLASSLSPFSSIFQRWNDEMDRFF